MSLQAQIALAVFGAVLAVAGIWSVIHAQRVRSIAESELASIGGGLLNAQEAERARIARELHDGISQQLAVLAIELEALQNRLTGSMTLQPEVELLTQRVRSIAADLQQVTHGLHPARLEHLGLVRAVRALAREMEHDKVRIDVSATEWPANLPEVVALSLYRVAQEALHNATKHSGTEVVSIAFRRDQDGLSLTISDQGSGFTPRAGGSFGGLGIVSMKQRLKTIGGSLTITGAPGRGTTVHARVPRQPGLSRFDDFFDLKKDSGASYQPAETTL